MFDGMYVFFTEGVGFHRFFYVMSEVLDIWQNNTKYSDDELQKALSTLDIIILKDPPKPERIMVTYNKLSKTIRVHFTQLNSPMMRSYISQHIARELLPGVRDKTLTKIFKRYGILC